MIKPIILASSRLPPAQEAVEIVERKGLGHPDTICDAVMESVAVELAQAYLKRQRVLVKLGVAEAPAAQVHYRGDPNAQVWIDPHSALYYCAGEDQYGKTADGRVTTQRDAQTDHFEPAKRAACN